MPRAGPRYGVLMADDEDWRLEAELDSEQQTGVLDRILGAARGGDGQAAEDVRAALGNEVVVTHDGRRLFAYAPSEVVLQDARAKIEQVLQRDGLQARIRASHWDEDMDAITRTIAALPPARTLDVACGTGFLTRHLRGEVTGIARQHAPSRRRHATRGGSRRARSPAAPARSCVRRSSARCSLGRRSWGWNAR